MDPNWPAGYSLLTPAQKHILLGSDSSIHLSLLLNLSSVPLRTVVLKLQHAVESPESLVKHRLEGFTPRVSDSASLELDLIIYISNKCPRDVHGAGTTPWEPHPQYYQQTSMSPSASPQNIPSTLLIYMQCICLLPDNLRSLHWHVLSLVLHAQWSMKPWLFYSLNVFSPLLSICYLTPSSYVLLLSIASDCASSASFPNMLQNAYRVISVRGKSDHVISLLKTILLRLSKTLRNLAPIISPASSSLSSSGLSVLALQLLWPRSFREQLLAVLSQGFSPSTSLPI